MQKFFRLTAISFNEGHLHVGESLRDSQIADICFDLRLEETELRASLNNASIP